MCDVPIFEQEITLILTFGKLTIDNLGYFWNTNNIIIWFLSKEKDIPFTATADNNSRKDISIFFQISVSEKKTRHDSLAMLFWDHVNDKTIVELCFFDKKTIGLSKISEAY